MFKMVENRIFYLKLHKIYGIIKDVAVKKESEYISLAIR